ncbi:MAG: hypothetical protein ABH864_01210 [archaeon]
MKKPTKIILTIAIVLMLLIVALRTFSNEDCDCSHRGDRSLDCLCLKGECVSVEA